MKVGNESLVGEVMRPNGEVYAQIVDRVDSFGIILPQSRNYEVRLDKKCLPQLIPLLETICASSGKD